MKKHHNFRDILYSIMHCYIDIVNHSHSAPLLLLYITVLKIKKAILKVDVIKNSTVSTYLKFHTTAERAELPVALFYWLCNFDSLGNLPFCSFIHPSVRPSTGRKVENPLIYQKYLFIFQKIVDVIFHFPTILLLVPVHSAMNLQYIPYILV